MALYIRRITELKHLAGTRWSPQDDADAQARLGQAAQAQPMQECDRYYENILYAKALACYKPLAEQGNAEAQDKLGSMYEFGQGVPEDYQQAVYWYKKAADQGVANALIRLGMIYQHGIGVPEDKQQALSWYRKAADQGDANALMILGGMYELGDGVPQDYNQAVSWIKKAADQGNAKAQDALKRLNQ